jgi:hypothetical protein
MITSGAHELRDWFLEVFEDAIYDPDRAGEPTLAVLLDGIWIYISEARNGATAPSRGRTLDHMGLRVDSLQALRGTLETTGVEPYLLRPNPPGSDLMFLEGPGGIHFEISERGAR